VTRVQPVDIFTLLCTGIEADVVNFEGQNNIKSTAVIPRLFNFDCIPAFACFEIRASIPTLIGATPVPESMTTVVRLPKLLIDRGSADDQISPTGADLDSRLLVSLPRGLKFRSSLRPSP